MKKTLLLTHEYYPFRGGIANYLHGYFKDLNNFIILTDQTDLGDLPNAYHCDLLSKIIRPRWKKGLKNVTKFVNDNNIELIFTPHILPLGTIAYEINKKYGIPYIISLHGLDINLALAKDRALTQNILNNATQIVTNSEFTKKIIQPLNLKTPVSVLTPLYHQSTPATIDKSGGDKYSNKQVILTVGRLIARKNHANIIKALAQLNDPEIVHLIIGSGPENNSLKALINKLNLQDKIEILNNVSHQALPNYYTLAKLFVMPTINIGPDVEGYGIVYLEAANYHLPIIAGLKTSAEDFLVDQQNALLVDGNNPSAIAEAIKKLLLNDRLAQSLAANAYHDLIQLATPAAKVENLKNILS